MSEIAYKMVQDVSFSDAVLHIRCNCMLAGREIYVGLSKRTNMLGAQAVAKAFPEYPTNIVKVHEPAVHLKDNITMAGPEVIAVAKSPAAQKTFQVSCPAPDSSHDWQL